MPERLAQTVFLVVDKPNSTHVFLFDDPRQFGFKGAVYAVELIYDSSVHKWPSGAQCPESVLGQMDDIASFRVFGAEALCEEAGYQPVESENFVLLDAWQDYLDCLDGKGAT